MKNKTSQGNKIFHLLTSFRHLYKYSMQSYFKTTKQASTWPWSSPGQHPILSGWKRWIDDVQRNCVLPSQIRSLVFINKTLFFIKTIAISIHLLIDLYTLDKCQTSIAARDISRATKWYYKECVYLRIPGVSILLVIPTASRGFAKPQGLCTYIHMHMSGFYPYGYSGVLYVALRCFNRLLKAPVFWKAPPRDFIHTHTHKHTFFFPYKYGWGALQSPRVIEGLHEAMVL